MTGKPRSATGSCASTWVKEITVRLRNVRWPRRASSMKLRVRSSARSRDRITILVPDSDAFEERSMFIHSRITAK